MFLCARRIAASVALICLSIVFQLQAQQASTPLPYTMTTLAGLSPTATTAGSACPTLAGATAIDAYGDGCPAINGVFGAAGRGGVQVDNFGNVFVGDDVSGIIHMINQTSGIMTRLAGGGTACSAKLDAAGDGCIAATQTVTSGQRGIGTDPYGNVLLAGYSDNLVHLVCRTASPLCTAAQVGTMQLVAGCSQGTGSNGTGGAGSDNVPAFTTAAGTCTAAKGEVYGPRGVTADIYGNVYFADTNSSRTRVVVGPLTSSYFSGANPIYAALGVYYPSITAGYAYTVVNTAGTSTSTGGTATSSGAACSVTTNGTTYAGTALDAYGDGCPLEFSSVKASSGYTSGVAVDGSGNMVFTDPTHGLRVFYVSGSGISGATMRAAIVANNSGVSPQPGFIYMLAGAGATVVSATPTLGNSTALTDSTITKVTISPQGHIFIGDSNKVLFFDINTGYIRTLLTGSANVTAGNYCSGSTGQKSLSAYSDACPASKSLFSNSNGLGVAVDGQGNLYLYDSASNTTGMLVRKVLAQGMAAQTLGTSLSQTYQLHLAETASGTVAGATATLTPTPDIAVGTPACSQNADLSVDCAVTATASPSAAGQRSAGLGINLPSGSWTNPTASINLGGTVSGSVLAFDHASTTASGSSSPVAPNTSVLLSGTTPVGVAVDGAGNVYTIDPNHGTIVASFQGGSGVTLASGIPSGPTQIAVDQQGNVFLVGTATPSIQELVLNAATSSYSSVSLNYTPVSGTAMPQAIAVDKTGNLFIADLQSTSANTAIYRLSTSGGTVRQQSMVATGFSNPVSLAVDGAGNVYVADRSAASVFKLTPSSTGAYTQSTFLTNVIPVAVAVDPGGDVYVQDQTTGSVLEVPVSGPSSVTVLTGLTAPTGLALDGKGVVYSADANSGITQVNRGAITYNFGTDENIVFAGTLTNAGNIAITGSNTVTNTTNFNVTGGNTNGCSFTSSVLGALSAGGACNMSATLVGSGSGTVSDVLSFVPTASTVGALTLTGTLQGVAIATTTTVSSPSPASPIYSAGGTEATFTVTVTAGSGATAPGGTVAVTIDSTTSYPTLVASGTSGIATVTVTGLSAGTHTISAVYSTSGSFTGSNSGTAQSFAIAQIPTTVAWTPGVTSSPVSQAIGTSVLNARVSPSVSGTFVYTATPSGGSTVTVDAASYLPIDTYTLTVTFTPIDAVNYTTSTATVTNFSVVKANTTASAGASTNVVAADGTGNYTSLSTALAALPTTGGTIYLKPGTYTGQNTVSYPNVALRGLGGDPTKVILTGEDGAFSSPFVYPGSSAGNANAGGDQGSSTLNVAKSAYIGSQATSGNVQYTPNGFYAEYLTIQNTYNTSTTTTSTYSTASGSCADTGVGQTLKSLYDSGKQCNSQALALWMTADQAVLNNVNLTSLQDTLYAGSQGCSSSSCTPARQYMWKGTIIGDVDYVFGDAALVFDRTNFFTAWHGTSPGGPTTIEAQNKKFQTGSSNDYLSGYICNDCTLLSQSTGMSNLYYGRPYGAYSTWIMLNSFVDQVNPVGWIEFSGNTNLPTSTYAEYNTQPYVDPAVGTAPYPASLFNGAVVPTGGNTGAGVNGSRETTSTNPGTIAANNAVHTSLTAAQAAQYYPVTFLSATVPTQTYSGFSANWNPVNALATAVNSFAPTGSITLNSYGSSVTILGRPQTPGAGLIPTGTYQFLDGNVVLASGSLDAAGEAYLTTSTLAAGVHTITMVYGGDANFNGSTSSAFTITVPAAPLVATSTLLTLDNTSSTYGGTITGTATVAANSGSGTPSGNVNLLAGSTTVGSCTLSSGACTYTLSGVSAGVQTLKAVYSGDASYATSTSGGATITIARAVLQVTANNVTVQVGAALPSYTATITGFVNSDTQATAVTGSPAFTGAATGTNTVGIFPITVSTGTLAATNYTFNFTGGYLYVQAVNQAAPVATGDTRTVTEPQFPAVCTALAASLASVNDDLPTSVDSTVTNPDGARIQAALNSCSGTGQAVELSAGNAGNNAFLTGPLSMPSNVTLLVDPGVIVFFSRNAQDYDKVQGTHTCGTINNNAATSTCRPLIDIPGTSTNVGIMGYGRLDGRGGDALLNAIDPYEGYSWWGLSAAANGVANQQNPRFILLERGASNITLYKITLRNSPLFHVSSTGGAVSNFTAWDVKVVTPTSSRNTDGIDPGNATNFTITRSWISDGDDNIAVGASGGGSQNISITNNHFFAGHGESIGSITQGGISNILFDGNMLAGNGFAGLGSSVNNTADGNSTAIRIKSANDRGGLVTGIQYSNSCFLDHKTDVQFTPLYNTNTGTQTPNFQNILMQNLVFLNNATTASAGSLQFTGAANGSTINPLIVTLDNVTFPSALSSSNFVTTGTGGTETNAQLTLGPGQVSSNFVSAWTGFAGSNGNTLTDNRTATTLQAPQCNFTYIAPELTGPNGLPQTISYGQNATAMVVLTPAVGGAAYPTGTVTLTDAFDNSKKTVTLTGSSETTSIPLSGLAIGTHTFTATYSGDTNYPLPSGSTYYTQTGPYVVTVNAATLASTSTALSGVPSSVAYGSSFTATAAVTGTNPTGTVAFVVNGSVYASSTLTSGAATTTITLPYSASAYSVTAIYSGDTVNAGSISSAATVSVSAAATTTTLSANSTTSTLGHPVALNATVTSSAGTPTGIVSFSYTTTTNSTATLLTSSSLVSGTASVSVSLPIGANSVTASYTGTGAFGASNSTAMTITVNPPTIVALPTAPIAMPYTISTIAGGSSLTVPSSGTMACAGAIDKWGNGCQATAIALSSADDLRAVAADPFGNVYFTDISAALIRRIAPNGIISNFAGRVTGTACVPSATTGCTPTLVSISKPRGISSDAAGNIFIADYSGNKVYKVSVSTGLMYLVAGTGTAGSTGDGGAATSAQVNAPRGVWGDTVGNIYIADTTANKIRVVDETGVIHTFAGTGTAASNGDGGPATSAAISNPQGVMTDANLNVYIADSSGGKIRVVCVTCGTNSPLDALLAKLGVTAPVNGYIYTIAGGAGAAYSGTYPTLGTNVTMSPQKLAIDSSNNLYISDGNGVIWFQDFRTGNLRPVASNASAVCAGATNSIGDGCPATQAKFGNGGNGIGVGSDTLGNIYISDTLNLRIRKVSTNLQSTAVATGTASSSPVNIHFIAGDTATGNGISVNSPEWTLSSSACSTNGDTTTDCLLTSTFTPAVPGARSTILTATSTQGHTAYLGLTGTGLGAGATLDPASTTSFGTGLQVAGLATDNAGNVYVADSASKSLLKYASSAVAQGSSAVPTTLAALTAPGAVVTDPRGYVYVSDVSTGLVTQVSPAGATSILPFTFTKPTGLAVDSINNLYVSDASAQAIYQVNPITGVMRQLPVGTLVAPAGLSIDPNGNLLIADSGAPALYRYNLQSGTRSAVSTTATQPSVAITDAAGNLLIADSGSILAVPASANSSGFTIATTTPAGLATDSAGNLYTGSSSGSILKLIRTQGYFQFANTSAAPQNFSLLESGNQTLQLTSVSQSDPADYSLSAASSTDCSVNTSNAGTLAIGGVCNVTATYTPTTYVTTTDTATFNGNLANASLSTPSAVQLTVTGPATAPAASMTLGSFIPASPVYGQSITVTATVTGASVIPAGTVIFTVDSATMNADLVNGVATATLPSLKAGSHSITASYTSSNGYTAASTSATTLVIGQAQPTLTWSSPAAITYGTPLSATQLNATSGGVDGAFTYTPALGTVVTAGAQTLAVTFTPTDTTDYTTATTTVLLTVTQATPTITWATPASVTYGTALSSAQLNATASVPGTFSYSPAAGMMLSAGQQLLSVTFTPNDTTDYTNAVQTVHLTVNPAASNLALSGTPNPAAQGKTETLTATVTSVGQPTGNVVFSSGTNILCTSPLNASGIATCPFVPSASGTLTITAQYQGDQSHLASTSNMALNVYDTSVQLQLASTQLVYPGATNVTVCVAGATSATPTGTVTIADGSTTLTTQTLQGNGCAYWYISPGRSAGSHSISATYSGNSSNPSGTSAPVLVTVSPTPVKMSASCWNSSFAYGANYQCTVNLSSSAGSPQGVITYSYDGSAPVSVALSSGNAQFTITKPNAGSHTAAIDYAQQANYAAATEQTNNFTVTLAPVTVSLTPSSWYSKVGTTITFQASIASWSAGPPNASGTVSFYDGSTLLQTVPVNSSGQASYATSGLSAGSHAITATYAGGTNYASGSASVNITMAQ
ncbi:pectinesterase family protein [Terriglobus albidus]|uniref:pectinesterase family protein n=1 Tax=Terriglobus albidus TaxID=1592106 RepID=UPI0021DFA970|nr:pectinesterase family protein [Terriglobus albidus]